MPQVSPQPLPASGNSKRKDEDQINVRPIRDTIGAVAAVSTSSVLSVPMRCLCWLAIVLLHLLVGVYFIGYTEVYRYLMNGENAIGWIYPLADSITRFDSSVRVVSYGIAIMHGLAVLNAVLCSLVSRELVFSLPTRQGRRSQLRERGSVFASAVLISFKQLPRPRWWVMSRLGAALRSIANQISKRFRGFVSRNEVDMLQVSNAVEVGLQIFQANKLSNLVAKVWINRTMALVIVANCWCLPSIHFWYRRKKKSRSSRSDEKLIKHVVDAVVDTIYGILIPSAIFYPYYRNMDLETGNFPFQYYYMDTWEIDTLAEANQVFVTSVVDFVSKMTPGVMLFHALWSIQALVARGNHFRPQRSSETRIVDVRHHAQCGGVSTAGGPRTSILPLVPDRTEKKPITDSRNTDTTKKMNRKRCLDFVLWCAGLLVLTLHIRASFVGYSSRDRGCLLELRPWTSRKYVCVVLEVSCSQRGILGLKTEIEIPLTNVEALFLQTLIFSHCPELRIPPTIQSFATLGSLKIYNSSIADWEEDAALTVTTHPLLMFLGVVLSNMSSIPPGLLSSECPLTDIRFCGTNLTQLPDNLPNAWGGVYSFDLELSPGITEVPPPMLKLPFLSSSSLSSNGIASIADDAFLNQPFTLLALAYNLISEIPESLMALPTLLVLDLRGTDVTELPARPFSANSGLSDDSSVGGSSWKANPLRVQGAGTAICDEWAPEAEAQGWDLHEIPLGSFYVSCVDYSGDKISYPLQYEIEWRSASL